MKFSIFSRLLRLLGSLLLTPQIVTAAPEAWLVEMPQKHGTFLIQALENDPTRYQQIVDKVAAGINGSTIIEHEFIALGAERGKHHEPLTQPTSDLTLGVGSSYIETRSGVPSRTLIVAEGEEGRNFRIKVSSPLGQQWFPTFVATEGTDSMIFLFERDTEAETEMLDPGGMVKVDLEIPTKGSFAQWHTPPVADVTGGDLNLFYETFTIDPANKMWVQPRRKGILLSLVNARTGSFSMKYRSSYQAGEKGYLTSQIDAVASLGEANTDTIHSTYNTQINRDNFSTDPYEGEKRAWSVTLE